MSIIEKINAVVKKLKKISFKEYVNMLGLSFSIYLAVNFLQFLSELIKVNKVSSFSFKHGVFYLNEIPVGRDIKSSLGFILLLFLAILYDTIRKKVVYTK